MVKNSPGDPTGPPSVGKHPEDFLRLARRILYSANRNVGRAEFLREITDILKDFSQCDAVELRLKKGGTCFRCEATRDRPFTLETTRRHHSGENPLLSRDWNHSGLRAVCRMVIEKGYPALSPSFTKGGSFWTGDLQADLPAVLTAVSTAAEAGHGPAPSQGKVDYASLVVIPLSGADGTMGLVLLKSHKRNCFDAEEIEFYESAIHMAGLALVNQLVHASLRERIKELTCLYRLAQLADYPDIQLEDVLQGIVELLPGAWQYPEITAGRITLGGRSFVTADYCEGGQRQSAEILIHGKRCGLIEVIYTKEKPELDEGPFLKEERSLIDAVARQITLVIERREAAEEKMNLQDQLRHTDRLATIGQLSAGVAHELNEPLGNILAFAQLAQKHPVLPPQVGEDLEKIVTMSLHAREVVKKLMLFGRQMPPQKTQVNLNTIVENGLYFLESRCAKSDVVLQRELAPLLPEITADLSQLHQVLVNVVVNAIQAMPGGGTLRISTRAVDDHVFLTVEDNGAGMSEDVLGQIFLPFFTTKDINEGTGLGLAVVHGIVSAHGGHIDVESVSGEGTRFEIRLPVTTPENEKETSPP
jgi:signal transduction histidine kinase